MIGLALLLAAAGATAERPRCAIQGWSNDADPAGLRVHAGPTMAAREIGRLPPATQGDDAHAPEFDIVDMRDGWVRIANIGDDGVADHARPVFRGTGWVHASRVTFTVQSGIGRAAPRIGAPIVVRADDWLDGAGGAVQPIADCSGGWARLRYRVPSSRKVIIGPRTGIAWFGGICGNQHTTCDSLDETRSAPGR